MINFNVPPYAGTELEYIKQAIDSHKICGDGRFTKLCSEWLERSTGAAKALLTTSCSHALDMAAMLCGIEPGDEVILPSFTFVSTANAFVLRGARLVFVDIRPDTLNLDENLIEAAITDRTKAIAPVHYAGVACEMDKIMSTAKEHKLFVIEDAAQGVMSSYKGRALGAIGDFGCFSFHETKNYSAGEGGALLIKDAAYADRAEIIREKGTDRSRFYRGLVDKYTWRDMGSSYLPSELCAAYLWAQLEIAQKINDDRLRSYNLYKKLLTPLEERCLIRLPIVPDDCVHNGHMFYIITKDLDERGRLIDFLKSKEILTVFHYIPLHSSPAGLKFGRFCGEDRFTTNMSERLVRLPMYYRLTDGEIEYITGCIKQFYGC